MKKVILLNILLLFTSYTYGVVPFLLLGATGYNIKGAYDSYTITEKDRPDPDAYKLNIAGRIKDMSKIFKNFQCTQHIKTVIQNQLDNRLDALEVFEYRHPGTVSYIFLASTCFFLYLLSTNYLLFVAACGFVCYLYCVQGRAA